MTAALKEKTAIVTGAARGIGLTTARELAREGVNIFGTDVRAAALSVAMQKLATEFFVQTMAVEADIGDELQVAEMLRKVYAQFGQVDILVNNAGIRRIGPVYETSSSDWDDIQAGYPDKSCGFDH